MKREKRDHVYVMQEHSHLPEQKSRLRCLQTHSLCKQLAKFSECVDSSFLYLSIHQ